MPQENLKVAIFAGGCFWCMEAEFDQAQGVVSTISGYTGGTTPTPDYQSIGDHYEALKITYDPAVISYTALLDIFWGNIDPTDAGGQFADRGAQYATAIFYTSEDERRLAEESRREVAKKLEKEVATKILPAASFYPAEEYHQDYHLKNPDRYQRYKYGSGRPARLKEIWGDGTVSGKD